MGKHPFFQEKRLSTSPETMGHQSLLNRATHTLPTLRQQPVLRSQAEPSTEPENLSLSPLSLEDTQEDVTPSASLETVPDDNNDALSRAPTVVLPEVQTRPSLTRGLAFYNPEPSAASDDITASSETPDSTSPTSPDDDRRLGPSTLSR